MHKKIGIFLIALVLLSFGVSAQGQYGIGRFERLQILADHLRDASRLIHIEAEREYPRFRSNAYVLNRLYRLRDEAANFENQLERNYDNPEALRRAYVRLYSAWYDADYVMQRTNRFGYLRNEFESVSDMVHQLGHSLPGYRYQNRDRYDNRDYDDQDY